MSNCDEGVMRQLELPRLYEPVVCERVDNLLTEARRLAQSGADEGTLLWAKRQDRAAPDRYDGWRPQPGGLACAIILRPETSLGQAVQINYVAAVALLMAVAERVAPMTALRHAWPGGLLLGSGKVGRVTLDAGVSAVGVDWLSVAVELNVEGPSNRVDLEHIYVQLDGHTDVSPRALLESFSRSFLTWLDRWANEGFEPVRTSWMARAEEFGQAVALPVSAGGVSGTFLELDGQGRAVLQTGGSVRVVSLLDYFALIP